MTGTQSGAAERIPTIHGQLPLRGVATRNGEKRVANGVRVGRPAYGPASLAAPRTPPPEIGRLRRTDSGRKKTPVSVRRCVRRKSRAAKPGCRIGGNVRIVYLDADGVKGAKFSPPS